MTLLVSAFTLCVGTVLLLELVGAASSPHGVEGVRSPPHVRDSGAGGLSNVRHARASSSAQSHGSAAQLGHRYHRRQN